jgi:hypothetical protein
MSKLDLEKLGDIWVMSDVDQDNQLSRTEFAIAMHIIMATRLHDVPVPSLLPACLHPSAPTFPVWPKESARQGNGGSLDFTVKSAEPLDFTVTGTRADTPDLSALSSPAKSSLPSPAGQNGSLDPMAGGLATSALALGGEGPMGLTPEDQGEQEGTSVKREDAGASENEDREADIGGDDGVNAPHSDVSSPVVGDSAAVSTRSTPVKRKKYKPVAEVQPFAMDPPSNVVVDVDTLDHEGLPGALEDYARRQRVEFRSIFLAT